MVIQTVCATTCKIIVTMSKQEEHWVQFFNRCDCSQNTRIMEVWVPNLVNLSKMHIFMILFIRYKLRLTKFIKLHKHFSQNNQVLRRDKIHLCGQNESSKVTFFVP